MLFARSTDPRRQQLIASVLEDFRRLSGDSEESSSPPGKGDMLSYIFRSTRPRMGTPRVNCFGLTISQDYCACCDALLEYNC